MRQRLLLFLFSAIFLVLQNLNGQTRNISGRVTDAQGNGLPGVSIGIKGNKAASVSTGSDGTFIITVPQKAVLVFSSVGFETKEVTTGEAETIAVELVATNNTMAEVVVTALGVKRAKRNLTYSTQEVKGEELVKSKEPNVVNALAGKVSGVQITSSSGTPGSSSRIVIRGASSVFGENQALIVLDGIPINNDETGNLNTGPGTNRLADIDPAIIESINVLKGAAATALYGSAGARGVVMITTKNGKENRKPELNLSQDLSFETPLLPERQTTYALGDRGVYYDGETRKINAVWGPRMDTLTIDGQPAPRYDPAGDFFKTGITSNTTASVAGGGSTSGYFISYSYLNQTGTVPNTEYKRHAFFTKYSNRIAKNLTSTFQFNYTNTHNDRMPEGYVLENPLWTVLTAPVSYNLKPYLNEDGTQRLFRSGRNNPYWALDNVYNKAVVNRFVPVINLNYTPLSWLTITERLGMDIYSEQDKYKENVGSVALPDGRIIERNVNFRQFNHDLFINAHKDFGDLNVELLLGNNFYSRFDQTYQLNGRGLTVDGTDNISAASLISSTEAHQLWRKIGFYTQANLDYKRLLILSLTGRYDGSSVLAKDNAFYPYGSAALGFVLSELLPQSARNAINFLKLRASYALVGNDGVRPYLLLTPFEPQTIGFITYPFNGQSGFLQSEILGNSLLKNEHIGEFEVGLETRLFNNRLTIEVSYFNKKTTNGLIPDISLAPSTGFAYTTVNSAKMENKGMEALVNATVIKGSRFSWDVGFNFTRIRNKVFSIYGDLPQLLNGFTQVIVGQPYGAKFGGRYKRTEDGQILVDDNGLPLRDPVDGIIGNISPDWLAGLNNTFRYGALSLSFFFDMKKGGDIENNVDGYGFSYGTAKATESREDRIVPGVKESDGKPNDIVTTGQDYFRRLNGITESVIQDGTYIKLRNVSIGYEVSKNVLAHTPFRSLALIVTGRNLWIYSPHFTGADPEVSSFGSNNASQGLYSFSTPTSRSVNFTVRVGF
ncbi:MAG: SusC/RagA family TonB-linked outer membrane protein [Agriterribacter sp.]